MWGEKEPGRDQQRAGERRGPDHTAVRVPDHEPSQETHLFIKTLQFLQGGN